MMKRKAAIFAVFFLAVLRGPAQVDHESMESWWVLGQKSKTIEKCTEGARRYRLVDGVVYDLKPLAEFYSVFTNALTSTNQAAMLTELSKWTNGRPLKGWILLTGTIEQITPKDGILMNVSLEPEKVFSDTKLVRVKNVPDLPATVDDTKLVILAKLTGKFYYEPAAGAGKEIESWDHGSKPTEEQIAQLKNEANRPKPSPQAPKTPAEPGWKSKPDGEAATLKTHQQLAEQGDADGMYKMGMRYLAGDGVARDAQKGRELLAKAAAKGQKEAREVLANLPVEAGKN